VSDEALRDFFLHSNAGESDGFEQTQGSDEFKEEN
jgi:hypothetical protein